MFDTLLLDLLAYLYNESKSFLFYKLFTSIYLQVDINILLKFLNLSLIAIVFLSANN